MNKTFQVIFIALIVIACGQEKTKNTDQSIESESQPTDFVWLRIAPNDSVKFKGFSTRYFNQGKDSVLFAHYVSDLYSSSEDSKNPSFKKQSIQVLNALSKKAKLPDSMYVQAVGKKSGSFIKKSSDYNILAGFDGKNWTISVEGNWYTLDDFKE